MITHPEHDVLLAHVDAELGGDEAREVATHVATCIVCSRAISSLQADAAGFAALLSSLDALEPADWQSPTGPVVPDVGGIDVGPALAGSTRLRPRRNQRTAEPRQTILRWAAGILLTTAVAASAAVVVLDVWPASEPLTVTPVGRAAPAPAEPVVASVIATPEGGTLSVTLSNAPAGARLHILLEDDAPPSVAVTGPDAPRFTAVAGHVDVRLAAATSAVRVTLPRSMDRVEIMLDGAVVATVARGSVSPAAAATPEGMPLGNHDAPTGDVLPE